MGTSSQLNQARHGKSRVIVFPLNPHSQSPVTARGLEGGGVRFIVLPAGDPRQHTTDEEAGGERTGDTSWSQLHPA